MGQSTTVATAFTAFMMVAGVAILVTTSLSSFRLITGAISDQIEVNEVVVSESVAFSGYVYVNGNTARVNLTNDGGIGVPLRDFDLVDLVLTYSVGGLGETVWVPFVQGGGAGSHWKVNRVFFRGAQGDVVSPMRLTEPVAGVFDPTETVEIELYLDAVAPTFEYLSLSTPSGCTASTSFTREESAGAVLVSLGDTFVDVSHGLGRVPVNVQVTARGEVVDGFWVGDVTSSGFRVYLSSAQGVDVSFYWCAE